PSSAGRAACSRRRTDSRSDCTARSSPGVFRIRRAGATGSERSRTRHRTRNHGLGFDSRLLLNATRTAVALESLWGLDQHTPGDPSLQYLCAFLAPAQILSNEGPDSAIKDLTRERPGIA